jgi:hypothetical protein
MFLDKGKGQSASIRPNAPYGHARSRPAHQAARGGEPARVHVLLPKNPQTTWLFHGAYARYSTRDGLCTEDLGNTLSSQWGGPHDIALVDAAPAGS